MEVINRYKTPNDPLAHYIGRGGPHGNPITLEDWGNDRELVLFLYIRWFCHQLANGGVYIKMLKDIPRGAKLECYCAPALCHGDVIGEYLDLFYEHGEKLAKSMFLERKGYKYLPEREGVDHINIYSASLTKLGRLTSNFTHTPFDSEFGRFESMEGFWYYISTGCKHEELKKLHGNQAKQVGKTFESVWMEGFDDLIEQAIRCKVDQTPELKDLLTTNTLPFFHYYFYGQPNNCKVVMQSRGVLEKTYTKISHELNPPVKLLVAGSRDYKDIEAIWDSIRKYGKNISEIVEGGAKGVDVIARAYAKSYAIPYKTFEVTKEDWNTLGKRAGMVRNANMGDYADEGLVHILNNSRGSTHMAEYLQKKGKPVKPIHISS